MTSRTPSAILRLARALITDPARWTTGVLARDSQGRRVSPSSPLATCHCAMGAVMRVAPLEIGPRLAAWFAMRELAPRRASVEEVNDRHGHEAVLALMDRTIQALEERGE